MKGCTRNIAKLRPKTQLCRAKVDKDQYKKVKSYRKNSKRSLQLILYS